MFKRGWSEVASLIIGVVWAYRNKPIRASFHIPFKSMMNEPRRSMSKVINVLVRAVKEKKGHWGWDKPTQISFG